MAEKFPGGKGWPPRSCGLNYDGGMTRGGVYAKGVAKRQEILETALEVVAAQGYRNASVRDIAEAANLSPAGLLHYFGSKEDLLVAIIQERDAKDGLRAPEVDFMTQFLTVMRENSKVPGLVYLYSLLSVEAADPDHPAHTYFVARRNMVTQLATEVIEGAQERGEMRSDLTPEWITRAMHALADGLQNAWLIDPTVDMAADIEQFVALLRP